MKFCKKCQTETARYGNGGCKPCVRASNAAWKKANPDKVKSIRAEWRSSNINHVRLYAKVYMKAYRASMPDWHKEQLREYTKRYSAAQLAANPNWRKDYRAGYYLANLDKAKAYAAERYAANKDRSREYNAAYRAANSEKVKKYQAEWSSANLESRSLLERHRRARKRNAGGSHTVANIHTLMVLQKSKCACCKTSIKDGYHVDHVTALVNGGSNDRLNIQLLCPTCNLQKHAKHPVDFMQSKGFLL